MNRILSAVGAVLIGILMAIPDADAASRRLGGGKNIGTQREAVKQQPPATAQRPAAAPQAPAAPAPSGASRWLGPLAGLAAGGLLAAMFMGGAFDGIKFMDVIMLALLIGAAFFVIRMLMRKPKAEGAQQPIQYAGAAPDAVQPRMPGSVTDTLGGASAAAAPIQQARVFPAGFNAAEFAQVAKQNFVRLQEANDRKDISMLRDFLTPTLYGQIEADIKTRDDAPQKTEIVTLDADVLEVVTEGGVYVASVRFDGSLREAPGAAVETFSEVWHLEKPASGRGGWQLAGIQQV